MSDPLPRDVPRLRTIERYLLVQLAAVRRAIEYADDPDAVRGRVDGRPRWTVQWRYARVGEPRRGVLHRAECWMAKGERLDIGQVSALRARPGRVMEPCEVCRPAPD